MSTGDDFEVSKRRSLSDLEKLAKTWRLAAWATLGTKPAPMDVLGYFQEELVGLKIEFAPDESLRLPCGRLALALADVSNNVLIISQSIVDGIRSGLDEAVFVLFHELGHLVLRHIVRPAPRMSGGNRTLNFVRNKEDSAEWQASAWARSFMAPLDDCANMSKDEIAKLFGLPPDEARIRQIEICEELGRINKSAIQVPFSLQLEVSNFGHRHSEFAKSSLNPYAQLFCPLCHNSTRVRVEHGWSCETCGGTGGCS